MAEQDIPLARTLGLASATALAEYRSDTLAGTKSPKTPKIDTNSLIVIKVLVCYDYVKLKDRN